MTTPHAPLVETPHFGHPRGLFTLFFAEMWERFSYYGMRALLMFYMIKGFLGYGDNDAYTVYGAYTALVYMSPFFGGMLADRVLGQRRAVVLGGLLMASGHLMMMFEDGWAFFTALALLICGNGFFKPNISTIVGALYPAGSPKRDGGFTIFYMGVNLGAAMSPLLCGYVGETYGWHLGFGLATIGMLTGLAVFANWLPPGNVGRPPDPDLLRKRPVLISQLLLAAGALAAAVALFMLRPDNPFSIGFNVFVGVSLLAAAVVSWLAMRGSTGALINVEWAVYLGTALAIPLFALLVSGFAPLRADNRPWSIIPDRVLKDLGAGPQARTQWEELRKAVAARKAATVARLEKRLARLLEAGEVKPEHHQALQAAIAQAKAGPWEAAQAALDASEARFPPQRAKAIVAVVVRESSRPAGLILLLCGLGALVYLGFETFRLPKVPRERMCVVLILTFFSMLFWAFFEQAGSSLNNFTDRNVDRVFQRRAIGPEEVGTTIRLQPTQAQLGYHNGDRLFTLDMLDKLRDEHAKSPDAKGNTNPDFEIDWKVAEDNVGMGVARRVDEIPASTLQAVNPIFILLFGLALTMLWTFLANRQREPSTPVKFAFGLLQLGLGFGAIWYGAATADERGMVALGWLLLGYLLHTTGELCLSPVGLSMVTKLSPARLVSTVMGTWFLATAFSQFLASIIAQFTGVSHGGADGEVGIPPPIETVSVYGGVFGKIAISAIVSALVCFALAPLLTRWMHPEEDVPPPAAAR